MPNPNHIVPRHEIFAQHSQVSSPQVLLKTIGDICDTLEVIQVAAKDVLDLARRLVGYMVGLKTALLHVRYQSNCIHKKRLVFFHMMPLLKTFKYYAL